jgi:hypothetical protein
MSANLGAGCLWVKDKIWCYDLSKITKAHKLGNRQLARPLQWLLVPGFKENFGLDLFSNPGGEWF